MKAYVLTDAGPQLVDIDPPKPRPSEVLVRVRAAALNRVDLAMTRGHVHGGAGGQGAVLGLEWAGEVVETGAEVEGIAVGQRVMGSGAGAFAEFAVADIGGVSVGIGVFAVRAELLVGHAAGARLLFEVCACEPCVGADQYSEYLRCTLSNAAHNSTRSVTDALAPLCTPDILRAALVASTGNGKSCYAFEEIWRHADGKVCVHEVAPDLGQSVARLFVRRIIRQLGKGVACKSVDCIYAHRRDGVVYRPDRPEQRDALALA